jgi:hypothetical protein
MPHLHSFAKKNYSLKFFIENDLGRTFYLPLSAQASTQLDELAQIVDGLHCDPTQHDSWSYTWGPKFISKKAYIALQGTLEASPLFSWLWKSGALDKHKFFAWLSLKDRLSTRNILRRKNMSLDDYSCVLCVNGPEETNHHLFSVCPFSTACWNLIGIH